MTAETVTAPRSPRSLNQCRKAVSAFCDRHPGYTADLVRRHTNDPDPHVLLNLQTPRLTVPVLEDDDETLTDLIVAARRDGIGVSVDFEGSYLWADLDFDGLTVRAVGYHTTCGRRYALETLAECPAADLDRVLGALVDHRKRWGA